MYRVVQYQENCIHPSFPLESLQKCIAYSQAEVLSWSAESGVLALRFTEDGGAEIGTIQLSGVSHVNIRPRFEIVGIGAFDSPFHDYPHLKLEDGEVALAFQDTESKVHLVIAESINYTINSDIGL